MGWTNHKTANSSKATPIAGRNRSPPGNVFSTTITPVNAAIGARLPTLTPNMTNIRVQQQPRQKRPCRSPRRQAAPVPDRIRAEQNRMGACHQWKSKSQPKRK